MNTILFSKYDAFEETHNIQILYHNPIRDKVAFRFREQPFECEHRTSGSYSNIIQDNENPNHLTLYYRVCCNQRTGEDHQFTCVAISNDYGKTFTRPSFSFYAFDNKSQTNIVSKECFSCHNFSVFHNDFNTRKNAGKKFYPYLAIGGTHNGKPNKTKKEIYQVTNYVWPNEKNFLLDPYVNNKTRRNGIYLYKSKDGYK